jgi:hypothetical protein
VGDGVIAPDVQAGQHLTHILSKIIPTIDRNIGNGEKARDIPTIINDQLF